MPQNVALSHDLEQRLRASRTGRQWEILGTHRRAGVATPLFGIFSESSCGIGELPDLKILVDWCRETGISIIQLLPLNDVGFNFRPYDAQSMFALDPMYLAPGRLRGVEARRWKERIDALKESFPCAGPRVDYRIKGAKLALFYDIFRTSCPQPSPELNAFIADNAYWLEDYALFRAIKEDRHEADWREWPAGLRDRAHEDLASFSRERAATLLFQKWLQWQLYEQFRDAKAYAGGHGVALMGDLPFLVSRDSADVWAHQGYFKLDLVSGAPPDLLYAQGQRWGMPPYDWPAIAGHGYDYIVEKLRYAENFYDLYRIDHVVGMFRLWTIRVEEPEATGGLNGVFDPSDEKTWEGHGRTLLDVLIDNTRMLACAEDLGTIPPCTFRVLEEYGIPGIDVQRWTRDWGKTYAFKD
ncbi:MAG: 4-alpha-glucanotransferase, partial [Deltaproteobacteria bacterium]